MNTTETRPLTVDDIEAWFSDRLSEVASDIGDAAAQGDNHYDMDSEFKALSALHEHFRSVFARELNQERR